MQEKYSQNSLLDVFTSLRKHFFGMVLIFISIVVFVTIVTFLQTPIYEVGAMVMVKYGREYAYRSVDQVGKGVVNPLYSYNGIEVINTELEIFRSNELAGKVIRSLGIDQLFPELAEQVQDNKDLFPMAVNRFRKQLSVIHIKASNVIGVTFQHRDPEIAVQAVNLLTELFKERHLQIFKNPQSSFLEEQVSLFRQQLKVSEDALRAFKQENRIFSIKEQQSVLLQQYVNVHSLLIDGNSRMEELAEKVSSLERQLETIPEVVVQFEDSGQGRNADASRSRLLKLKLDEHELAEKYPENNRLVVAVRKDIEMVKAFIENQDLNSLENVRTGQNIVFQKIEQELLVANADFVARKAKNESIKRQLKELEEQLQKLTEQEINIRELKLQVETTEETYKSFVGKLEDSRIQDAMDSQKMVNVVVIEKPMVPVKPVKPKKGLNILVGIILATACSLSYALLRETVTGQKK